MKREEECANTKVVVVTAVNIVATAGTAVLEVVIGSEAEYREAAIEANRRSGSETAVATGGRKEAGDPFFT